MCRCEMLNQLIYRYFNLFNSVRSSSCKLFTTPARVANRYKRHIIVGAK